MSIQDSFLLDEVRCGFMIPAAMKQAWAAELEVLMEIDRVCKKHNIQYFADWGTLLGTVRHGGFIPWDDDLDIVMKREDYNKFMTVAASEMEEGFEVRTFRNHNDNWLFMAKVVGRNNFCFDKEHLRRFHNFPYIACVDVFVLDYVYRDPEKEEKRRRLCKYMLGVADNIAEGCLASEEKERSLKTVEKMYGKKISRIADPVEMRRYLYGEVEKIFGEVPEQEADKLTQLFPWGLKGNQRHYAKECYAQSVELPFEYTYMPVPVMYDKMLRQRYREYYRLVKDAGAHNYPFFEGQKKNLQKVLDFELPEFGMERAKLFRGEEEEEGKNLSYKVMAMECFDELGRMKEQFAGIIENKGQYQESMEQAVNLLQASQQLAIDFGNMMEQVLEEGCILISLLEQYCEMLYVIYEQLLQGGEENEIYLQLNDILQAIANELEQNILRRKMVLFLPVLAKDWDSLHGLWQEYVEDTLCDVYVAPLPYYYKDYDGSPRKVCYEATEFPEVVYVLDYNILTPEYLEILHPEVIVIQNPYDSWNPAISVPEIFYSENIRKYTDKLVYVPPFELEEYSRKNAREYFNMKYYVTMPGVVYADRVMVQSENMRQVYIEKLTEFAGEETRDVWEQRVKILTSPVIEQKTIASCEICEQENKKHISQNKVQKKKILYGISLGAYIGDIETVQSKIERNLQLFEEYKEKSDLVIHIFPDSKGADEVRCFITRLLERYAGKIVEKDTKCHAGDYDAYYGDAMPLMMEFRDAGKPVMVQNVEVTRNKGKVSDDEGRIKIVIEDVVRLDNRIWFCARNFNSLFSMDLVTNEVVFCGKFPDESYGKSRLYASIKLIERKIYFIPMYAKKIVVYCIDTNDFFSIDIEQQYIGKYNEKMLFMGVQQYRNFLYILPVYAPVIIRLNLDNNRLDYITEWNRDIIRMMPDYTGIYFRKQSIIVDNKIYVPFCNANAVLELDCDTMQTRIHKLNAEANGYAAICEDGKAIYLSPRDSKNLVKWDLKSNESKVIKLYENASIMSNCHYSGLLFYDSKIWAFPTAKNSEYLEKENVVVFDGTYSFAKEDNNELMFWNFESGLLSIINQNDEKRSIEIAIDSSQFDLKQLIKEMNGLVVETIEFGIRQLVEACSLS